MKLFFIQFSPSPTQFLPLRSKHSPQYPILKNPLPLHLRRKKKFLLQKIRDSQKDVAKDSGLLESKAAIRWAADP
jgi:hypothetical protein